VGERPSLVPRQAPAGLTSWDSHVRAALSTDAQHATERGADAARPSGGRGNPFADLPGRIMAHVLRVPALEIRDPVALRVLMESGDPARHAVASRRIRTHAQLPL
jgi:hypothetical protein